MSKRLVCSSGDVSYYSLCRSNLFAQYKKMSLYFDANTLPRTSVYMLYYDSIINVFKISKTAA